MLHVLMAKLEAEVAEAAEYTKLAWQWKRTYNSHVEAANRAYATMVRTFKEMQQKDVDIEKPLLNRYTLKYHPFVGIYMTWLMQ